MEKNMDMEIQSIHITAPYSKKIGEMSCRITLKNEFTGIDLKLDSALLKPVIDVVAAAIVDAGRQTAENLQRMMQEHIDRDQPVIEHAPQKSVDAPVDEATVTTWSETQLSEQAKSDSVSEGDGASGD